MRRKQIMLTIGNRNYEIADTTQGYASLVAARKRCAIRIAYGAVGANGCGKWLPTELPTPSSWASLVSGSGQG